jgi:DNA-binding response OmpR family regulator
MPTVSAAVMNETQAPVRVLVVDDEPAIREILVRYLTDEGMTVTEVGDGLGAVRAALTEDPHIMLLDLNLPLLSGVEVLRRVREQSNLPIIMLTRRDTEIDRILGLELGADDYIAKPFSPREVVARVKSVLRRTRAAAAPPNGRRDVRRIGDLEIDRTAHEVRSSGRLVSLTPTEFRILDVLADHIGQALTRDQLLDKIASDVHDIYDRTLDRHIANLRHKIEADPSKPRYVLTVFGVGYKMVPAP